MFLFVGDVLGKSGVAEVYVSAWLQIWIPRCALLGLLGQADASVAVHSQAVGGKGLLGLPHSGRQ